MLRFSSFRLAYAAAVTAAVAVAGGVFACSSSAEEPASSPGADAGKAGRDAGPVDPLEGGSSTDAGTNPPPPSCTKYCDLVQKHCTGENAQYADAESCLAFCAHLPPGDPWEQEKAPSLACRQYYAGNPALTDPAAYCAAAGPFGGGLCGDRCTAFCEVTLSACAPDAGEAPFPSLPACKTACADFAFRDAGTDGGGEGLDGPTEGNTLNCRLFHLRKAVVDDEACADLGADASACR